MTAGDERVLQVLLGRTAAGSGEESRVIARLAVTQHAPLVADTNLAEFRIGGMDVRCATIYPIPELVKGERPSESDICVDLRAPFDSALERKPRPLTS